MICAPVLSIFLRLFIHFESTLIRLLKHCHISALYKPSPSSSKFLLCLCLECVRIIIASHTLYSTGNSVFLVSVFPFYSTACVCSLVLLLFRKTVLSVNHILPARRITRVISEKKKVDDFNACNNVRDILYNTDVITSIVQLIVHCPVGKLL